MRRRLCAFVAAVLACVTGALAQPMFGRWGQQTAVYDGEFTFVRLRWKTGTDGWSRRGMPNNFWLHEFPGAERNLMGVLKDVTLVDAKADGSLILALDDPHLFKYPIAVMWEPGYWIMTDAEAALLRQYLTKGGFLIVNDFELDQWDNFEAQTRRVVPGARWIKLDASHLIFQTFFRIERPDIPHAAFHHLVGLTPQYYGLFEDNDPTKRLMAIANYNTNLAEYWQIADSGFFPIEPSNNAFRLGINYMMYGLTH
jgi:uncharacterized protein DUF4159